jgi:hypothetical protein
MRAAVAIGLVACAPVLAACGTQAAKPLPDDRLQSLVLQPSDLSPTLSRFSFGRELRSEQSPVLSGDPSRFGRQGGWGAAVAADGDDVVIIPKDNGDDEAEAPPSGVVDFRDVNVGSAITECPQAGLRDRQPKPNDLRQKDEVEKLSDAGNNIRFNQDYSCFPQDETSIAVNPADKSNVLGSANDYRLGWGTSGFYASTDNGEHFYGRNQAVSDERELRARPHRRRRGSIRCLRSRWDGVLQRPALHAGERRERHLCRAFDERRLHMEPALHPRWIDGRCGSLRGERRRSPPGRRRRGVNARQ